MGTTLIRCDGSDAIGMGHVQRCLSLALALRGLDNTPVFVMRRDAAARALVEKLGFDVHELASLAPALGAPLESADCQATCQFALECGADHVVIDHYGVSEIYLESLVQSVGSVGVIDDLADRDLTAVDWVLNPNPVAENLPYVVRNTCQRLLGPQYALLRPSFYEARRRKAGYFGPCQRQVLITLGGGNNTALAARIIETLNQNPEPMRIRCVLPGNVDPLGVVGTAATQSPHMIQLLGHVDDIVEQMLWADVSINGAGATSWELCCLGVPMVLMSLAENQQLNAAALAQAGCAINAGDPKQSATLMKLGESVAELLDDAGLRAALAVAGQKLVDGNGARRAAKAIIAQMPAAVEG